MLLFKESLSSTLTENGEKNKNVQPSTQEKERPIVKKQKETSLKGAGEKETHQVNVERN